MRRRDTFGLLAASLASTQARAQGLGGWPDKPVRLIVPAPGGAGTADTVARIVAQELEKRLPQRVVVDNRAGANGNIGAVIAARSPPDGYTLLWSWAGTLATNPALYRDTGFDPVRDFEPIVLVGNVPNILVVNRQMGVTTMEAFTDFARRNPGAINFGSTGNGSSMHLAGELYRQMTRTEMVHVPYQAPATAVTDLLSNRIQVMFNLITGAAPQVRGGQVVPIAVLSDRRAPQLPDVPTTAEVGLPGLTFGTWFGILAPKGTPQPIIAEVNRLVNEVIADPVGKERLEAAGLELYGGPPARLAEHLASELRRHAEIVRVSGARIE